MKTLDYLCNVIGARLTGSPAAKRANEWTRDQMSKWGLQNAHLEAWGPFGRGWTLKRYSLELIEPLDYPLRGFPKAWSPGMTEPVEAEVVFMDALTEADPEKYKGTLKGKIVMIGQPRGITPAFQPLARRFNDDELAKSETYPAGTALAVTDVVPQGGRRGGGGGGGARRGGGGGPDQTRRRPGPGEPRVAGVRRGRRRWRGRVFRSGRCRWHWTKGRHWCSIRAARGMAGLFLFRMRRSPRRREGGDLAGRPGPIRSIRPNCRRRSCWRRKTMTAWRG